MKQKLVAVGLIAVTWLVLWRFFPMQVRVNLEGAENPGGGVVQELQQRYGPGKHSMGVEEWILREIFQDRRDGFFVDVGAADARVLSNTYHLESALGWSGLAIDPQTSYAADYTRYRPRTRFLPFFVSSQSDAEIPFYVAGQKYSASAEKAHAERFTAGQPVTEITVSTITLDDLLAREGVTRVDLLTMDIEQHEPEALKGFTIERWRPLVVCIEVMAENRQLLTEYFTRHGYVLLTRYIQADLMNFYFVPLSERTAAAEP